MSKFIWAPNIVVFFLFIIDSFSIIHFNVGLGCTNANLTTSYEKYNYKPDIRTVTVP